MKTSGHGRIIAESGVVLGGFVIIALLFVVLYKAADRTINTPKEAAVVNIMIDVTVNNDLEIKGIRLDKQID